MHRARNNCFSARKLPEAKDDPRSSQPSSLTLKQLSLSFYNTSTKKSKKQIFLDCEQLLDPSDTSIQQSQLNERAKDKPKLVTKSVSLKKDRSVCKKEKEIRTHKEVREALESNQFIKSSKSNHFQIKNLVIQNYYSPYAVPQSRLGATTVLRNKSQIKSLKKKRIIE